MTPSRRKFLKIAAGVSVAPFVWPSRLWAQGAKPNDRITMGFIGMGKQNRGLLRGFMGDRRVQVLAVCDVDTTRRDDAKKSVDDRYTNTDCAAYNDYRQLIARDDIDAVCIATPDHWHALQTIAAVASGKDVFCEKPLTHNIHEAIEVMKAVEQHGRMLQTGSMQRSMREFRVACELVRNGVIGKISHVHVAVGGPPRPCDLPAEDAEPGLDWDMWLGPAPVRPYNSVLSPRGIHKHFPNWRSFIEYGGGAVADWGAHHLDIAHWALDMDQSGPTEITPPGKDNNNHATLIYGDGIRVVHYPRDMPNGVRFFGADGELFVSRGKFELKRGNQTIAPPAPADGKVSLRDRLDLAERQLPDGATKLRVSTNHLRDFLSSIESRRKPITHEQIGARTAIACHLLNLAYLHKQPITWNPRPRKLEFTGGTGNPAWLTREYRSPWKV